MSVRFLADANLKLRIPLATVRREPAVDFAGADQAGLVGLPDSQVLAIAAKAGRILVTHARSWQSIYFHSPVLQ